ncbi:MAG TPA: hypothetical protein VM577_10390 [Anaerovoracaceae bacterium]|nr:hypothetical protein [Anaerovoracaceae bacterium]
MIYKNQINLPAAPTPNVPAPGTPAPTVPAPNPPSTPAFAGTITSEQLGLISNLRQLWMQMAIWSRSLIVSTAANLADIQMITDRLEYLPEAFSGVLNQYFEPHEADHFGELLEEHISTVAALIDAEKNNDDRLVNQETVNLYSNANQIAAYLVSINSYWSEAEWRDLLNDYIEMLLADLVARLGGDYAKEIDIFDDLQTQAIKIADYMAQGMMQKFHP